MKTSSLIGHLVEIFDRVLKRSVPVDRSLNTFFRNRRYLGARDRRFIADHLYDMLRHVRLIEFQVDRLIAGHLLPAESDPRDPLLWYIIYAVKRRLQSVAEVCAETCELRPSAVSQAGLEALIGAIEQYDLTGDLPEDPVRRTAIIHSIPDFIVEEWFARLGPEGGSDLAASMNTQAPISLRVNRLVASRERCMEELEREGVAVTSAEISPDGLRITRRVNIPSLNSFRSGFFEIQDEGSQILSFLVNPERGGIVVDACAGAGGKALHLGALMNNEGCLVLVEPDQKRRRESMVRSKRSGVTIMQVFQPGDSGLRQFEGRADRVLVDAPCSGSGVFRRNPGVKLLLSQSRIEEHIREQEKILREYAPLVRPGGRLVYATCSLLAGENEGVVRSFLDDFPVFTILQASDVLSASGIRLSSEDEFLRLDPHRHGTDGFFGAVLRRGNG